MSLPSQQEVEARLAELNHAWHASAKTAYGHSLEQMDAAVQQLDAMQAWFKQRNINLDYDGGTGEHSLSATQPARRSPSYHCERLEKLERMRRQNAWF